MPRNFVLAVVFLSGSVTVVAQTGSASEAASQPSTMRPVVAENYGKLPLSFEANQGQSDSQVKFLSRSNGYSHFLADSAAVLTLTKEDAQSPRVGPKAL